jgi:uncharacterized membrane protein
VRRRLGVAPAGLRVAVGGTLGIVVGSVVSPFVSWQAASMIGWDAAAGLFVAWVLLAVWRLDVEATKTHASREDPSLRLTEAIVLGAGIAMLTSVGLALVKAGHVGGAAKAWLIALGVLTLVLSWTTVHVLYALRYARGYYAAPVGGIDFNEADPPTYLDFAYLSFTIGMTFQVSDTNLTSKPIRRIALGHGLLSYLYGAMIIAMAINVVASLLG